MNFSKSFSLFKDKWILFYSVFPVLIGSGIYFFLGKWLYSDLMVKIRTWIDGYLNIGDSVFLSWAIGITLTLILFYLISFTAVILISLIASPFNDLISSRTEQLVLGRKVDVPGGILGVFIREFKKFFVIMFLSFIGIICSFFPGGQIISFILTVILTGFQFLDYSWSRHNYSVGKIIGNYTANIFRYGLSGFFLYLLIGIPFINILVMPFCVVHFTVLYCEGLGIEETEIPFKGVNF
jgi:CysZ protein